MARTGAVIVAAGRSTRMGGIDKVFAPLAGRPLVGYSLTVLDACPAIERIVLVVAAERLVEASGLVRSLHLATPASVCAGGERRQDSVRAGLATLGEVETVVVHDAARPLVTERIVTRGLNAVRETGAAVAAIPAVDTLKEVDADGTVVRTPPRERLWIVQTPQVFAHELLVAAHDRTATDVTDDAMLVEALGHRVKVFLGSPRNLKVTTPDDLVIAEALLRAG